jgi:hypothetical protein
LLLSSSCCVLLRCSTAPGSANHFTFAKPREDWARLFSVTTTVLCFAGRVMTDQLLLLCSCTCAAAAAAAAVLVLVLVCAAPFTVVGVQ